MLLGIPTCTCTLLEGLANLFSHTKEAALPSFRQVYPSLHFLIKPKAKLPPLL